ncbi:hypothetical protein [Salmonella enterica]|uniref:hypothetical protein n=1 Tax=Salmonella enterica TaxID=28901 RepID=UPI001880BCF5|nr:hypothetical protein [Salmonella enterica]EDE6352142.1 hypothetical protein [Salmonella enterica subsp. enterica serovar Abony]MBE8631413.1 hypothetical protein [Salmonella enterica subsp. enterica serovar Bahrenfeld]
MPELAGFILFIRNTMGVNADALADDDPAVSLSWSMSLDWVNRQIACISPVLYSQAVYNLAASFLLNFGSEVAFGPVREKLGINNFTAGVISASSDESTSQTRVVSDALKNLSLADLQQLKDPYGRWYLAIAQQYGDLWGLT